MFSSLSPRGASSVYVVASGALGPGRRACSEPSPLDCEYCTNPTLEAATHTRGAATGWDTDTHPRAHGPHGRGWGAPPSRVAVRGILCLFKSLYVHADNPESLCTTKS